MVAKDSFLAGQMARGKEILEMERTRLSKPQAKQVAKVLASEGRMDDAMTVLLLSMSEYEAKESLAPAPTAKVGDILYSSWGYDQTNIDFYQVTAVSGSSATVREIAKNYLPSQSSRGQDAVMPAVGSFIGPPKKKRVQKSGGGRDYRIKIDDSSTAWPWDGKPKFQTASGFGH